MKIFKWPIELVRCCFVLISCCIILSVSFVFLHWVIFACKTTTRFWINWLISFSFCCRNSNFSCANSVYEFGWGLLCFIHTHIILRFVSGVDSFGMNSILHSLECTWTNLKAAWLLFESTDLNLTIRIVHSWNLRSMIIICIIKTIKELALHVPIKITMKASSFAKLKLFLSAWWLMRLLSKT